MRSSPVVMIGPLLQEPSQVIFIERDDVIEKLPAKGTVQTLTVSIRERCPRRSSEHFHTHVVDHSIDRWREGACTVVDQPVVAVFPRERLSKLLNRPVGRWMRSDVRMENSATANLHDHENVEHLEAK